jgi:iron(III) transport system ATP-binding protein
MLPPDRRELGMVFQSYAIWPHMTVGQNVAYPLKARRVGGGEIARRVVETLELVGLGGFVDRPASKLSGGQQQRVALARAIIARPRVLLFDEPLSNLDAKLRARMRFELLRLQRDVGITSLFVTHDQFEAMAIADELIVMNNGKIEQWADARTIYSRPATTFVADFIGTTNFLRGELIELPDATGLALIRLIDDAAVTLRGRLVGEPALGARYLCVMRAEDLHVAGPGLADANRLEVKVEAAQYLGSAIDVRALMNEVEIRFSMEPHDTVGAGQRIQLEIAPAYCAFLRDP